LEPTIPDTLQADEVAFKVYAAQTSTSAHPSVLHITKKRHWAEGYAIGGASLEHTISGCLDTVRALEADRPAL
jgi:hypothetical protein